jgi:hypothetical protein
MAILARRNFGPFALIAAPVLSRHLIALIEEQQAHHAEKWRQFNANKWKNSVITQALTSGWP